MAVKRISHITIYVEDQEAALQWYCDKLGFQVCMDNSKVVPELRWLTVSPADNNATQFVLMPVRSDNDRSRVGNNLMTVLACENCYEEMDRLKTVGVEIVDEPQEVPWGVSGVIRDLYGIPYNLVSPQ